MRGHSKSGLNARSTEDGLKYFWQPEVNHRLSKQLNTSAGFDFSREDVKEVNEKAKDNKSDPTE